MHHKTPSVKSAKCRLFSRSYNKSTPNPRPHYILNTIMVQLLYRHGYACCTVMVFLFCAHHLIHELYLTPEKYRVSSLTDGFVKLCAGGHSIPRDPHPELAEGVVIFSKCTVISGRGTLSKLYPFIPFMHLFIPFMHFFRPFYTQLYPFIPQQKNAYACPKRISATATSGF